ncbi:hypothetical protein Tco_0817389 [Tanacetum coccineum]
MLMMKMSKLNVRKDEDVEMKDAEVDESDKGEEKVTDAAKEGVEKTSEAKDDTKKTELPPSSLGLSVSLGFDDQFLKLSSDSSLVSTVKDSADTDVSSLLDIPIQQDTPQIQSPSVQNVLVSVIPETTNLLPIPKIVTETPFTTVVPSPQVTPIISTVQQTPTPIPTQRITTDAPTVTIVVPESNSLTVVELKVAKLEKDVSELKTVDHSSEAFVVLQSQVPTVVDSYLDTKHLPELTKKLTPTAEQESKKSPSDILMIKKEQAEKQKKPQFTIKSTNKAALKEYDLKSALYQSMHANKSFNRNPANHQLYHALMQALIEDENAMDKGLADTVKDHKRKHDDEDDDDEDPPARPNQGKKTKRRRTKESESTKNPSSTKDTTKVEEPITEVIMDDAGDVVHDDNLPQDTLEPKARKTLNPDWFKQPPRPSTLDPEWNKRQVVLDQPAQPWFNQMVSASKDPLTFNDLMATPIDFSKYVLNGLKIENLTQDILLGPSFNMLKGTCSSSIELEYNFQECFNALTDKLDWNNPEGDRYPFDLSNPLPLQGPSVPSSMRMTKMLRRESSIRVKDANCGTDLRSDQQLYKFKEGDFVDIHLNNIEDMLFLAVQHKLFHLDESDLLTLLWPFKKLNITKPQKTFPKIEFKEPYTPSYDLPGIIYEDLDKQKRVLRADELYKFLDSTLKSVRDEIHHRVLDFRLDYNMEMPKRKWTAVDRKRSGLMIELIDKQLREREIIRNLERLVGARELEMDYKLMTRTV